MGNRFKQIPLKSSETNKKVGVLHLELIKDQIFDEEGIEDEKADIPEGLDVSQKSESEKISEK